MIRSLILTPSRITVEKARQILIKASRRPLGHRTLQRWVAIDKAPDWAVKVLKKYRASERPS